MEVKNENKKGLSIIAIICILMTILIGCVIGNGVCNYYQLQALNKNTQNAFDAKLPDLVGAYNVITCVE